MVHDQEMPVFTYFSNPNPDERRRRQIKGNYEFANHPVRVIRPHFKIRHFKDAMVVHPLNQFIIPGFKAGAKAFVALDQLPKGGLEGLHIKPAVDHRCRRNVVGGFPLLKLA
jgi:hypothetical protein